MNETRPHLEVVPEDAGSPETPGASAPAEPAGPGRRFWIAAGVLAVALVICAGGWWSQARESASLQQRLGASQAALADTRAALGRAEGRLAAFEDHLDAAQARVGALARQIGALGDFLAEGPGASPAEPAPEDAPAF